MLSHTGLDTTAATQLGVQSARLTSTPDVGVCA